MFQSYHRLDSMKFQGISINVDSSFQKMHRSRSMENLNIHMN